MLVNDHRRAGQLAAAERRVTWELGLAAGATRSDLTAEGNRRASVAPDIGWPLGRTLFPYGALDAESLGLSVGLGSGEGSLLGDAVGDGTVGNALAITPRIFAMVAAFRYAG